MFESINFSKLNIDKRLEYQEPRRCRVKITLKGNSEDGYGDLEKIDQYCQSHNICCEFYGRDRDNNAPVLPCYREKVEQERTRFSEAKSKASRLLSELRDLGDILEIDFMNFGSDPEIDCGLDDILQGSEYDVPLEYREEIWDYEDVELTMYFKHGSEVYHFFKEMN